MGTITGKRRSGSLTTREREILGLLAAGLSGAEIAEHLVLSPETVRTHVRNAMSKLGASTRSQAVVLALKREEIPSPEEAGPPASASREAGDTKPALDRLLQGLMGLYDVDAAVAYAADEDGLSLRLVGRTGEPEGLLAALPGSLALGEGALGRAALERRAQLVSLSGLKSTRAGARPRPLIVAPMVTGGRLVGVLGLAVRASRPTGRGELLLAQAFATRIGEIVAGGGDQLEGRLQRALDRFRTSWSATTSI